MDIMQGACLFEVTVERVTTETEVLSLFVRADTDEQAADKAWEQAQAGRGFTVHAHSDVEYAPDSIVVQFIGRVGQSEDQYA